MSEDGDEMEGENAEDKNEEKEDGGEETIGSGGDDRRGNELLWL